MSDQLFARTRCLMLLLFVFATVPISAKTPEIPLPDDARVSHLAQSMRVNGNDVMVRTFETKESTADVVNFYRDEWGEERNSEPGFTVMNLREPWILITRIEDGYLMTVQVRPTANEGTEGMLGFSKLPERRRPPKLGEGFPTMGKSQVLNEIMSKDPGQSGRTMWLKNNHDLHTNVAFYKDRYGNNGWAFDMDRSFGGIMHVLAFRKGRKRVNLVLSESKKEGIQIVVNEVTFDIL
ncbi:MAG: hypothetical protein VCB07_07570 [Gammaproteobacteria bacterium]